ncbi:MAG: hypothetical protein ACSHWS_06195 [Sulfitobacter sp.]
MNRLAGILLKSTYVHVAFAFAAMGGWAIFANSEHPMPKPIVAGLVQGSISAVLTLFLKRSVDWMRPKFRRLAGYVLPALIASLASTVLLIMAHTLAATPEITTTIVVPLTVSALYIFSYNFMRQLGTRQNI